jgi:hypothetical protein
MSGMHWVEQSVCETCRSFRFVHFSPFRIVYYETIKREVKTRPIKECRFDERLKIKDDESTGLIYTGLFGENCLL